MWFLVLLFIAGVIIFAFSSFLPEEEKQTSYQGNNMPQLPSNLNVDFILLEMEKVRHAPSMLEAYFRRLKSTFTTEQERQILAKIIAYNETVAKGVASQAETYKAKTELEEAITAYNIARNGELRKKKELVAHSDLDVQIAQNELNLAELKKRKDELLKPSNEVKEVDEVKEQEKTKEKRKPTPEERRERDNEWEKVILEDMFARTTTFNDALMRADIKEKEEEMKIREMGLSPEEEEEQINRMKIVFAKLRLEISKKYGQGRS